MVNVLDMHLKVPMMPVCGLTKVPLKVQY